MSDVIDLTADEPDAKRQNVDLSKDISDLGSDLMQKVFENLPLREQARAAMASKDMKGAYDVARGNLLARSYHLVVAFLHQTNIILIASFIFTIFLIFIIFIIALTYIVTPEPRPQHIYFKLF